MSWSKFDDDCPGCQPAMMDVDTGQMLPQSHPHMQAIYGVWGKTTREEREAWHRVTCQNSRAEADLALVGPLTRRMQDALTAQERNPTKANPSKTVQ